MIRRGPGRVLRKSLGFKAHGHVFGFRRRLLSRASAEARGGEVLVRDFIREALYGPKDGYFTTKGANIIISPPPAERIPFPTLKGYWDYQLALDKLYKSRPQAWMTPVEVFAPHYSRAIARYILEAHIKEEEEEGRGQAGGFERGEAGKERAEAGRGGKEGPREDARVGRSHERPSPREEHADSAEKARDLCIYEIGGGYGTNALCILDYLEAQAPEVYRRTRYTVVEISRSMAEKQRERLRPRHGHVCRIVEQDAVEWATATGEDREWEGGREGGGKGGGKVRGPATSTVVVLALEVLDNLPHDKVLWTEEGGEWRLRECVVRGNENTENYREHHRALADERIALLLQLQPALARRIDPREQGVDRTLGRWQRSLTRLLPASLARTLGGDRARPCAAFVPTGMVDFVEGLCTAFPRRHHFLFADFDSLPPPALEAPGGEEQEAPDLRALNPPLVTSRDPATGQHCDHPSYLSHKGSADIFFPVDFALLQEVYRFFASRADRKGGGQASVRVLKSARFLERYGEEGGQGTCTRSGYNPMLEDFLNTCFFVAEAKDPSAREGRSRRATPRSRR